MFVLWLGSAAARDPFRGRRQPSASTAAAAGRQHGGQGGALRRAPLRHSSRPPRPEPRPGAVNAAHDSFTPLGGAVPLVNMMLGEVSPGRRRRRALRHARLCPARRVHRRADGGTDAGVPRQEDPGGGDEARRALPAGRCRSLVLTLQRRPRSCSRRRKASILNPGPHGLSEVLYAFTSASNNNGSAFGGLTGNTDWYNTTLGLAMLGGPLPPDRAPARDRRVAGAQAAGARRPQARSRPHAPLRRRCWSASS